MMKFLASYWKIALLVWSIGITILLAVFFGYKMFSSKIEAAAFNGREQMLELVMTAGKECKPVMLYNKSEQITLTNPDCKKEDVK